MGRIENEALGVVLDFFVSSGDFNGLLAGQLAKNLGLSWRGTATVLENLLAQKSITIAFQSHQDNPHILRLQELDHHEQIRRIHSDSPDTFCVYPSKRTAKGRSDLQKFSDRPFTLRLALAEPQLTPVFFELSVLEKYHLDPRYHFFFKGYSGRISTSDETCTSTELADRDQVFIQTFGIGYDNNRNRVIVVFLRYLHRLTHVHQQIWKAHIATKPCTMNGQYAKVMLYGIWPRNHSAYEALLTEISEINKISCLIGKPHLFNKTFEDDNLSGFHPMLRPTKRNFDSFIHLLDKIINENISKKFFEKDIPLHREIKRADGKIEVQRLNTLNLLDDWLRQMYRPAEGLDVRKEVITPLKAIRTLRQKPAHAIEVDSYDLEYPRRQTEVVQDAVVALQKLRLIFSSHPLAKAHYKPPAWLDGPDIVFF